MAGHDTTVLDDALSITNDDEPDEASWFPSPAKLASAVAVPASVFDPYVTSSNNDRPPAPVTSAVHGDCGKPSYVTDDTGHDTTVLDDALSITNDDEPDEAEWLLSPAKLASAVAVPASVFDPYVTSNDNDRPPAPVTSAVHGDCGKPSYVTDDTGHVTAVDDAAGSTVNNPSTCIVVV